MIDNATADKEYASLERRRKAFRYVLQFTAEVASRLQCHLPDELARQRGKDRRAQAVQADCQLEDRIHLRSALRPDDYGFSLRPVVDRLVRQPHCRRCISDTVLEMDKTVRGTSLSSATTTPPLTRIQTDGVIVDPVSLVSTTGTLPTNGGTADPRSKATTMAEAAAAVPSAPRLRMIFWSCSSACRP